MMQIHHCIQLKHYAMQDWSAAANCVQSHIHSRRLMEQRNTVFAGITQILGRIWRSRACEWHHRLQTR